MIARTESEIWNGKSPRRATLRNSGDLEDLEDLWERDH